MVPVIKGMSHKTSTWTQVGCTVFCHTEPILAVSIAHNIVFPSGKRGASIYIVHSEKYLMSRPKLKKVLIIIKYLQSDSTREFKKCPPHNFHFCISSLHVLLLQIKPFFMKSQLFIVHLSKLTTKKNHFCPPVQGSVGVICTCSGTTAPLSGQMLVVCGKPENF